MKIERMEVQMTMPVRHRPYVVSNPGVRLVGVLEEGDKEVEVFQDLKESCRLLTKEMVLEEIALYKELLNAKDTGE